MILPAPPDTLSITTADPALYEQLCRVAARKAEYKLLGKQWYVMGLTMAHETGGSAVYRIELNELRAVPLAGSPATCLHARARRLSMALQAALGFVAVAAGRLLLRSRRAAPGPATASQPRQAPGASLLGGSLPAFREGAADRMEEARRVNGYSLIGGREQLLAFACQACSVEFWWYRSNLPLYCPNCEALDPWAATGRPVPEPEPDSSFRDRIEQMLGYDCDPNERLRVYTAGGAALDIMGERYGLRRRGPRV